MKPNECWLVTSLVNVLRLMFGLHLMTSSLVASSSQNRKRDSSNHEDIRFEYNRLLGIIEPRRYSEHDYFISQQAPDFNSFFSFDHHSGLNDNYIYGRKRLRRSKFLKSPTAPTKDADLTNIEIKKAYEPESYLNRQIICL